MGERGPGLFEREVRFSIRGSITAGRISTGGRSHRSISLRPDEDARLQTWFGALNLNPITDLNAHGTLVSSIVASNSGFFAGVTKEPRFWCEGVHRVQHMSTAAILNGIVYAWTMAGCHQHESRWSVSEEREPRVRVRDQQRVLIMPTVGDADRSRGGQQCSGHDHTGNIYFTYCNSPHVVCVSATGPRRLRRQPGRS